jgi:hypothetical protein
VSEAPDSLVLRFLRRIDGMVDRLALDVTDLKTRMTLAGRHLAGLAGQHGGLSARIDRIERRLDLPEASR